MAYERCVIFGAGEYYEGPAPAIEKGMLAIAADGGLDHMRAMGLSPDFVIGDFDSLSGDVPDGDRSVRLPPQKDDPDLLSALKVGWSRGAREFHIYGALGGRIDHTIANMQLMALLASHGGIGYLYGDGSIVTAIADGALEFPANHVAPRRMISVFSHSDVCHGVTIAGLLLGLFGSPHVSVDSSTTQTVFMYTWLSMAFIIALPAFVFARVPSDTHQNVAISRRKRSAQ